MGIMLFWIVLSVVVGAYYHNKGGAFWKGLALSLLFSPLIGFALCLVTNPEETKVCPACAEEIKEKARKCKHCGEELKPATPSRR